MKFFAKTCDHEPTLVYSTKNANYYAADGDNVRSFNGDLIINLSREPGIKAGSNIWSVPELSKHMEDLPEEICLMWRDFVQPPVKPSFWNAIDVYAKKKKYRDICFNCGHGHGRTGTAICAMMIANSGTDAESAISRLRESYCKQAVETEIQVLYLLLLDSELNGRVLPEDETDIQNKLSELTPIMRVQSYKSLFSEQE